MFTHILVPLDGSELAEAALPAALELARKYDSQITLLQVIIPPYLLIPPDVADGTHVNRMMALQKAAHEEAEAYLEAKRALLAERAGYNVHTRVVEGAPTAYVILDEARDLAVDLIAMSTHGRTGLGRWVLGSIAEKVLRHAEVPVLLLRATEPMVDVKIPPIENRTAMIVRNHL